MQQGYALLRGTHATSPSTPAAAHPYHKSRKRSPSTPRLERVVGRYVLWPLVMGTARVGRKAIGFFVFFWWWTERCFFVLRLLLPSPFVSPFLRPVRFTHALRGCGGGLGVATSILQ